LLRDLLFERRVQRVSTPVITLAVNDIEATVVAVEKHSGRMGEKMQVDDMDFATYFNDNEGNLMGLPERVVMPARPWPCSARWMSSSTTRGARSPGRKGWA